MLSVGKPPFGWKVLWVPYEYMFRLRMRIIAQFKRIKFGNIFRTLLGVVFIVKTEWHWMMKDLDAVWVQKLEEIEKCFS